MSLCHEERLNVGVAVALYLPSAAGLFADALGHMLRRAEARCGPRDDSYRVWTIYFAGEHPQVFLPKHGFNGMSIRLSERALRRAKAGDCHLALWQLAHEVVHLLSPTRRARVSVLEEGLACCFQHDYMETYAGSTPPSQSKEHYAEAESLVRQLLDLDGDVIARLRHEEPVISQVTAATLCAECPGLPWGAALALERRFYWYGGDRIREGPWSFQVPKGRVADTTPPIEDGSSWVGACPPRNGSWASANTRWDVACLRGEDPPQARRGRGEEWCDDQRREG